jgi:MFS family permease
MTNDAVPPALSPTGRYVVLICAFLGWFCAGFHLAITTLAMQPAATDLLGRTGQLDVSRFQALNKLAPKKGAKAAPVSTMSDADKTQLEEWNGSVARWNAWLVCAFLFGAASGGLVFGRIGDRLGRSKSMALSILTYSSMAAAASFAQSPLQLLVLWYLACTGVGGMWPNGVALVSEAWSSLSRAAAAGVIGTSANIGIFLVSTIAAYKPVTVSDWRWIFWIGAAPLVLGLFSLFAVPESPRWLASRRKSDDGQPHTSTWEVFHPPLLRITLVGILLATIPLFGGWGSANWMVPWAGQVGEAMTPPNPLLKAYVSQARSVTGIVGSLLGGWIGSIAGRRRAYFLASLLCLASAQIAFWFLVPTDPSFLYWVGALGFFSGIFFGWLPLFLPELFPTRVRSTGAGVSFNFGRILTAITVFASGALISSEFIRGDYARLGRATSLIFALGMLAIWFAPDTSQKQLED